MFEINLSSQWGEFLRIVSVIIQLRLFEIVVVHFGSRIFFRSQVFGPQADPLLGILKAATTWERRGGSPFTAGVRSLLARGRRASPRASEGQGAPSRRARARLPAYAGSSSPCPCQLSHASGGSQGEGMLALSQWVALPSQAHPSPPRTTSARPACLPALPSCMARPTRTTPADAA